MIKEKITICLNVILHYGKYRKMSGQNVKITKNNGYPKYDYLVGKIGYISGFDFKNLKKPFIVRFCINKKWHEYCFSRNEFEEHWCFHIH